jgi:hypothetical protein
MYTGDKITLTELEKSKLIESFQNEEIKFVALHNPHDWGSCIRIDGLNNPLSELLNENGLISIFKKFKGDNNANEDVHVSVAQVDSSIIQDFQGYLTMDKKILFERLKNMVQNNENMTLESKPITDASEFIRQKDIKFFIKANDESINSGNSFKVQIGHEKEWKIILWKSGEYREECTRKAEELQKLFADREFSVIEDPLGAVETTIIKNSPLSKSLKKRIMDSSGALNNTTSENRNDQWMDDNKIVKIGDGGNNLYIDVTSEVSEIIKAERNANKKPVEVKIDATHFQKMRKEQEKNVRIDAGRLDELKFNLNFLQKIIGKIVECILVLLHIRTKNDERYDVNKINSASDLKNLRGESKTWADQMKFDSVFDAFIERNNRPVRS